MGLIDLREDFEDFDVGMAPPCEREREERRDGRKSLRV